MRRPEAKPAGGKLKVMVSSTVRGLEPLLDQVYGILGGYGYEVWMSHKGTIPVHPREDLLQTSLRAVQHCDFFLGIITGFYNRSIPPGERSIAHQEFLQAVRCDKARWFLVHHDVKVANELLRQFRFSKDGARKRFVFKKTDVLEDLRVLEMYECAIGDGNWAQPFIDNKDVLRFIEAQFAAPERLRDLLRHEFTPARGEDDGDLPAPAAHSRW